MSQGLQSSLFDLIGQQEEILSLLTKKVEIDEVIEEFIRRTRLYIEKGEALTTSVLEKVNAVRSGSVCYIHESQMPVLDEVNAIKEYAVLAFDAMRDDLSIAVALDNNKRVCVTKRFSSKEAHGVFSFQWPLGVEEVLLASYHREGVLRPSKQDTENQARIIQSLPAGIRFAGIVIVSDDGCEYFTE